MKQISGVDEKGFYLLLTYETKDPEDTDKMLNVLYNPEVDSKVKNYDDDHVEVIVKLDMEVDGVIQFSYINFRELLCHTLG